MLSFKIIRPIVLPLLLLIAATHAAAQDSATPDAASPPEEMVEESSLTLLFTNNGEPLEQANHAKFYLFRPGKRGNYLAWGHAARTARFEPGTYDVVIRYEDDAILEERVWKEVEIVGDFIERVAFEITPARLTVDVNSGGRPIDPFTGSFSIYPPGGTDKPVARRRPGTTVTVRQGTYDIVVVYRDPEGLKTTRLNDYVVEDHRIETVELGVALARLTVTLTRDGRPLPEGEGSWRVALPGQRRGYVARRASGETLTLEPGTYDIGAFHRDGEVRSERWLANLELAGDVSRSIEVGTPQASLRVRVTRDDREPTGAWCTAYEAGDRSAALASAGNGDEMRLDPGRYDIGCFVRDSGPRIERWLEDQTVQGDSLIEVELDTRSASLQLHPRGTPQSTQLKPRLLVLLDGSTVMRIRASGSRRIDVVRDALRQVISGLPSSRLDIGLRVYGAALDGGRNCSDSQLLVSPAGFDRDAFSTAVERVEPNGYSALAYALEQAAADFPPGRGNSIVIVTSGVDSCEGEPCAAAAQLMYDGVVDRISVIGFDVDRDLTRGLDCIGHYYGALTLGELKSALREVIRDGTRGTRAGTFAVFNADHHDEWVTGGAIEERIRLPEGRYDFLIHLGGKTFEWDDVRVAGDFEALAGERAPRGATGRERK